MKETRLTYGDVFRVVVQREDWKDQIVSYWQVTESGSLKDVLAAAAEAGRQAGVEAACWYDADADEGTYRRVLQGIRDSDPAILDTLPGSPLSGEWADGTTPRSVVDDVLGVGAYDDAFDNVDNSDTYEWMHDSFISCWEQGFEEGCENAIVLAAKLRLHEDDN